MLLNGSILSNLSSFITLCNCRALRPLRDSSIVLISVLRVREIVPYLTRDAFIAYIERDF